MGLSKPQLNDLLQGANNLIEMDKSKDNNNDINSIKNKENENSMNRSDLMSLLSMPGIKISKKAKEKLAERKK
jgi:hypothetical protein